SATDRGTADTQTYSWVVKDSLSNVVATGNTASLNFTPTRSGVYVATLTVTDDDGGVGTDSSSLSVQNAAPVATITGTMGSTKMVVGQKISFDGLFTDVSPSDTHAVTWFFGDGTSSTTNYGPSGSQSFT